MLKGNLFKWTIKARKSFDLMKRKVTDSLILALLDFSKVFEVEFDASNVEIGAIHSQEG